MVPLKEYYGEDKGTGNVGDKTFDRNGENGEKITI